MNKKRLQKICLLLLFLLPFYSPAVQASSTEKVNLRIEVSQDGLALANAQFKGEGVTTAYEKIKNGTFSETDTSSASWQAMRQMYEISGDAIELSPGISIGPGKKLSDADAEAALKILFSQGQVTKQFLQSINEADVKVTGGTTNNSAQFFFKNPENAGKTLTNAEGGAVASIEKGYYVLMDSEGSWLKFIYLEEHETVKLDLSNLSSSGISAEIKNLSENSQNNLGQYVIEYGQEVIYQAKISKDLLKSDATLTISPRANLIIDSASLDFTTTNLLEGPIELSSYGVEKPENSLSIGQKKEELEKALYHSPMNVYSFSLPASNQDVTVEIKAHLSAQIDLEAEVIGLSSKDGENSERIALKIGGTGGDVLSSYHLPLTVSNESSTQSYLSNDSLISSGINFVVADPKKGQLLDQHKYILGKEVDKDFYLYKSDESWEKVSSDFKKSSLSAYKVFGGNRQYVIGNADSLIIPLTTNRENYDEQKQTALNQSLIQIRGLGAGENYFLYQVQAPEGYESDERLHYFEVFSDQKISANGSIIKETSMGTAKTKDLAINSQLPAYEPGVQDYHLLNANLKGKGKQSALPVITSLSILVIALLALAGILMRFT